MRATLRLSCATVVTALAAATLAAAPVQAEGQDFGFTKHTTKRSVAKASGLAGTRAATSTTAPQVFRIAGSDRIQTAIEASFMAWDDAATPDGVLAKSVVLTRYDEYADALGGAALAGAGAGPLLMTPPTTLRADVKDEIDRVLGGTGTIYVLGGVGAVSADIETQLTAAGYTVTRLAGADRFDTSVEVAEQVGALVPEGAPQFVFATTGLNFPDGLAAGATAGGYWASVVLTRDDAVTPSVGAYLESMQSAQVPVFAVGGATASSNVVSWDWAFAGADRFETAALVADGFWTDSSTTNDDPVAIGLATGVNWPDALAGGAFMAGWGPLVLSRTDSLPAPTTAVTEAMVASGEPTPVQAGFVFGGTSVVGATPMSQFGAILGG